MLGVPEGASDAEVRRAYLELARRHHPDYFAGAPEPERRAAEARMRAVNEAWAVLGDPARRRAHDASKPAPPFRPFDTGDDDPDPRDQPDIPYRPMARPARPGPTLTPALLLGSSLVIGGVSLVMMSTVLLAVAAALLLLSCVGFIVVPLLALGRAHRDEG